MSLKTTSLLGWRPTMPSGTLSGSISATMTPPTLGGWSRSARQLELWRHQDSLGSAPPSFSRLWGVYTRRAWLPPSSSQRSTIDGYSRWCLDHWGWMRWIPVLRRGTSKRAGCQTRRSWTRRSLPGLGQPSRVTFSRSTWTASPWSLRKATMIW